MSISSKIKLRKKSKIICRPSTLNQLRRSLHYMLTLDILCTPTDSSSLSHNRHIEVQMCEPVLEGKKGGYTYTSRERLGLLASGERALGNGNIWRYSRLEMVFFFRVGTVIGDCGVN
jgi:hypothetical protein